MNNEEIRVKVAEFLGFKPTNSPAGIYWYNPDSPLCEDGRVLWDEGELPNYSSDLNACAEFEKGLTDEQWAVYSVALNEIACRIPCGNTRTCGYTISATAMQRCIAFLRVNNIEA